MGSKGRRGEPGWGGVVLSDMVGLLLGLSDGVIAWYARPQGVFAGSVV